jgi:hypothetical protein
MSALRVPGRECRDTNVKCHDTSVTTQYPPSSQVELDRVIAVQCLYLEVAGDLFAVG